MKIQFAILISIFFISCSSPPSQTPLKKNSEVTLNANIQKSNTQLIITNDDSFDWKNVTVVINKDYRFKVDIIPRGSMQKIGFMNFADGDNKLLDPFEYKIVDVQIYCTTSTGNDGFVSAAFQ